MSQTTNIDDQDPPDVIDITLRTNTSRRHTPKNNPHRQNKPQSNATAVGALLFTSGGMNMAMGLGWTETALYSLSKHFCHSWFIGVIIGTVLSVPLCYFLTAKKKWIMVTSACLILVDGILFASLPTDYDNLLAARYLNGIAIGLIVVPFLIHASEIAVDSFRGSCLMTEQYALTFGIAIQMIYTPFWPLSLDFPPNRLHGIFDIIFGIFPLVFITYFTESPIDYIRIGDDMAALNSLARLQYPQIITANTHAALEQQKFYYQEEKYRSSGKCCGHSALPLIKMLLFRSAMLAFSYNLPLNLTLRYSVLLNGATWAATVAAICRVFGAFLAFIMVDHAARRGPSAISAIIMSSLLISQASMFGNISSDVSNISGLDAAMSLYIVIQAFGGFFACYTSVYLAEAFPWRAKPSFMAFCVIVEQIVQIVLIETISLRFGDNLLAQGIVALVVGVLFYFVMPETKNASLAEAQESFRNLITYKRL
ncbi:uncharacterized protein [Musca autumnalis]|uniref:uncharacterized protein n=1 Tax=Musca autumnalis TaxID=221902 RepID=UPI003CFAC460